MPLKNNYIKEYTFFYSKSKVIIKFLEYYKNTNNKI